MQDIRTQARGMAQECRIRPNGERTPLRKKDNKEGEKKEDCPYILQMQTLRGDDNGQ